MERGMVSLLFTLPLYLPDISPILTKSNHHFIFPPIQFRYNCLFYLISLLGFSNLFS
jgi:hypothetical protein